MSDNPLIFSYYAFFITLVIMVILLYQSWVNIRYRKLTGFSLDALVMLFVRIFGGKKNYSRAIDILKKNPNRVRRLGVITLLVTLGLLQTILHILRDILAP